MLEKFGENGARFFWFGDEIDPSMELTGWNWAPTTLEYLEEGGGFCGDSLELMDWNDVPVADPNQPNALQLYENIMIDDSKKPSAE